MSEPRDARGAGIPSPTKDRKDSVKIALGTDIIAKMITCPIVFGRISLKRITQVGVPKVLEARIYSALLTGEPVHVPPGSYRSS